MSNDGWIGFVVGSCFLGIGHQDKVSGKNKNPERTILNFETKDVKAEFERIKATGATVVKEPYSMDPNQPEMLIATFEDPDGDYFQLMSPWEDKKKFSFLGR